MRRWKAALTRPRTKRRSEAGFTLIELMVVLLIIGILAAIAIPTYLGSRNLAEDTAAQTNLRTALSTAQVLYSEHGNYSAMSQSTLQSDEPALSWQFGAINPVNTHTIAWYTSGGQWADFTAYSASGLCWDVINVMSPQSSMLTSGAYGPADGITHPGTFYGVYKANANQCVATTVGGPSFYHSSFATAASATGL